jgi:hypothetical protein
MQQNEEKHGSVQLALPDRTVPFEVTVECTLPDYRSEISRLLWVRPTLLPPERFIGGGKAEFSGKLLLEILYTGPDGALYGAEHEGGYSFTVPLEGTFGIEGIDPFAEPAVDAVISRVSGPRRLSVRCRSHALVRGFAEKPLSLNRHGIPEGTQPYLLSDVLEVGREISGREEILLSDTLPCEEGTQIICARGSVFPADVHAATDEVCVNGEVTLSLLASAAETALPNALEKRIPFEAHIPLEGARHDHLVRVSGKVGRIECAVQDGQILLSAQLILTASTQKNELITLYKDAFIPGQDAVYRFEDLPAWQGIDCCNRHFSISCERAADELGIGEETQIIDHVCEAEICERVSENGKTVLIGRLQCHLLCRRGGEFCIQDATLPFRLSPGIVTENARVSCDVSSVRLRLQNGVLRADAELHLCICGTTPQPLHALCDVSFTPCSNQARATIELYYPAPGQTLWDVAKKYGVSPDELAESNALDSEAPAAKDSLGGKHFLLIP